MAAHALLTTCHSILHTKHICVALAYHSACTVRPCIATPSANQLPFPTPAFAAAAAAVKAQLEVQAMVIKSGLEAYCKVLRLAAVDAALSAGTAGSSSSATYSATYSA